jgi:RNA polymerase sigma factor (sigma-70 family)
VVSKKPSHMGAGGSVAREYFYGILRLALWCNPGWYRIWCISRVGHIDRIFRLLPRLRHGRPNCAQAPRWRQVMASTLPHNLVASAIDGNVAAIDRLLAATAPNLKRYARQHCQSQDVDDAVQDALWIIHQRIGALRSLSSFAGWSFRIVRRLCLKISMAERKRAYVELDENDADQMLSAEQRMIIISSIAALPEHYREVLLLSDMMGHSANEIAEQLSLKVEAAKSRLHRARMMVRSDFSESQTNSKGLRRGVR